MTVWLKRREGGDVGGEAHQPSTADRRDDLGRREADSGQLGFGRVSTG